MSSSLVLVLRKGDVSPDIHRAHQDQTLGALIGLVFASLGMLLPDLVTILLTERRLYSPDDSSLRDSYERRYNYELTEERERFIELIEAIYSVDDEDYLHYLRGVAVERLVLELVRPKYARREEQCLHNAEVDRADGSEVSRGSVDVAAWSQALQKGEFYQCKILGDIQEEQVRILERIEVCCVDGGAKYVVAICSIQRQGLLEQRVADSCPNISPNIALLGAETLPYVAEELL